MMRPLATAALRVALALLPADRREIKSEQWAADLSEAEAFGLGAEGIARGCLASAVRLRWLLIVGAFSANGQRGKARHISRAATAAVAVGTLAWLQPTHPGPEPSAIVVSTSASSPSDAAHHEVAAVASLLHHHGHSGEVTLQFGGGLGGQPPLAVVLPSSVFDDDGAAAEAAVRDRLRRYVEVGPTESTPAAHAAYASAVTQWANNATGNPRVTRITGSFSADLLADLTQSVDGRPGTAISAPLTLRAGPGADAATGT